MVLRLLSYCRRNAGQFLVVTLAASIFLGFIGPARAACIALGLVLASVVLLVFDTTQSGASGRASKAVLINIGAAFLSLVTLVP